MKRDIKRYEREGYDAMAGGAEWRLTAAPYKTGWRRDAWLDGAWNYMCEQRKKERS